MLLVVCLTVSPSGVTLMLQSSVSGFASDLREPLVLIIFPEEFMPNLIVPRYKSCVSFCSVFSDIKMTIVRVKKMKLSAPTFYQI